MESKLAINGGIPTVVQQKPHYVWPVITDATRAAVLRQLDESISIYDRSGIIEKLENRVADYHGRRHALLTSSGTAALHSLFASIPLQQGDEVICPTYTFFASASPLLFTGAIPVFADSRDDGNIDPGDIERKITPRTKGILVTHVWGLPCDMDAILDIGARYGLPVFEDGSHAHGALYKGKPVGSFGVAAAFSLQGQKTLTGGEGGFLVTDTDDQFYRALLVGHYNKRCRSEIPKDHPLQEFAVTGMGLKLRIHPLAAAIADEQFDNLETVLKGRRMTAARMIEELRDIPGIRVPKVSDDVEPSWYAFVMQYCPEELGGLPIEQFYDALVAEGCSELDRPSSTRPIHSYPLFKNPGDLFPSYAGYRPPDAEFPNAERFHANALKLPVWHDSANESLVAQYIEAIQKVARTYGGK